MFPDERQWFRQCHYDTCTCYWQVFSLALSELLISIYYASVSHRHSVSCLNAASCNGDTDCVARLHAIHKHNFHLRKHVFAFRMLVVLGSNQQLVLYHTNVWKWVRVLFTAIFKPIIFNFDFRCGRYMKNLDTKIYGIMKDRSLKRLKFHLWRN